MKHITKKALSLFLALCLIAALGGTALAAEGDVRETNFFPHDLYHADLDYSGMKYERFDMDLIDDAIQQIRELMDDPANAGEVEQLYWKISDEYQTELSTMVYLLTILASKDAYDQDLADESLLVNQQTLAFDRNVKTLTLDLMASPCGGFLDGVFDEDQLAEFRAYGDLDPNMEALTARESELVAEYNSKAIENYTVESGGVEWDTGKLQAAILGGELGYEEGLEILTDIIAKQNEVLGGIYLELLEVRKEIAAAKGYDSYPEYAYKESFHRDFTPEQSSAMYADIKEYIVPLYQKLQTLSSVYQSEYSDFFSYYYLGDDGDGTLDLIAPYIGQLSSELLESFNYLRDHQLYDTLQSDTKAPTSFTAPLPMYGSAFYFHRPNGGMRDVVGTTVHEFGHFNNAYYSNLDESRHYITLHDGSTDTMEVHSQGLELLFTHFYPELFDEKAGMVDIYLHMLKVSAIIDGVVMDELEQYAYETDHVTLQQLNEKYYQICQDYGLSTTGSRDGQSFGWVGVNHPFTSPFYYVSYCVSAAGAYSFWNEAQTDYFGAVDKYLQFAALEKGVRFQKSFETVGLSSPLAEGYFKELSEMLYEKLDLGDSSEEIPFEDVDAGSDYYDAILWAVENEITKGTSATTFSPDQTCTQAQIITFLWRAMGEPAAESEENPFPDVDEAYYDAILWAAENGITEGAGEAGFDPDAPCTRAQSVSFQWRAAGQPEASAAVGFEDVDAAGDYAAAVAWAVENGITKGTGDTTFSPDVTCTRAQIVTFLYRDLA